MSDSDRSCGNCSACCAGTGLSIKVLDKPNYEPCQHLVFGHCTIYEKRPKPCREFNCQWRLGLGRLMERPDKVGYYLDVSEGDLGEVLVAREAWSGAFDDALVKKTLGELSERRLVIRVRQKEQELIGPERLLADIKRYDFQIVEVEEDA